jgi:hypothetical protein
MTQNCNCYGDNGKLSQTVAAVLERPRYSPGLILEDSDLTAAVEYTRDLNRLLYRNLFGCGVVCGLIVSVDEHCGLRVRIGAGLALDGCGDPVQLPKPVEITVDERTLKEWKNGWTARKDDPDNANKFWIVLCGKEKFCQPRALVCDSDEFDGATQHTRIRSQAEVTITTTRPECVCRCAPLAPAKNGHAQPDSDRKMEGGPAPSNGDDCNAEHNLRDECADDCGCGTACACGCCVLLAEVGLEIEDNTGTDKWQVRHDRVRRLVRPMMVADHEPPTAKNEAQAKPTESPGVPIGTGEPGIIGDDGKVVAYTTDGSLPVTGRELGQRFVEYVTKSKAQSLRLRTLGVVLANADDGIPDKDAGGGI